MDRINFTRKLDTEQASFFSRIEEHTYKTFRTKNYLYSAYYYLLRTEINSYTGQIM